MQRRYNSISGERKNQKQTNTKQRLTMQFRSHLSTVAHFAYYRDRPQRELDTPKIDRVTFLYNFQAIAKVSTISQQQWP